MKAYQDTFSIKKHKLQGPRIYLHYCLYTDKKVPAVTIPFTSYIHISFSFVFRVSSIFDIYILFPCSCHTTKQLDINIDMEFSMKLSLSIQQYTQRNERKDLCETNEICGEWFTYIHINVHLPKRKTTVW